ncbi:MAG: hypothetical protein ACR2J8_13020 [Thermomicrobiales bacterium]
MLVRLYPDHAFEAPGQRQREEPDPAIEVDCKGLAAFRRDGVAERFRDERVEEREIGLKESPCVVAQLLTGDGGNDLRWFFTVLRGVERAGITSGGGTEFGGVVRELPIPGSFAEEIQRFLKPGANQQVTFQIDDLAGPRPEIANGAGHRIVPPFGAGTVAPFERRGDNFDLLPQGDTADAAQAVADHARFGCDLSAVAEVGEVGGAGSCKGGIGLFDAIRAWFDDLLDGSPGDRPAVAREPDPHAVARRGTGDEERSVGCVSESLASGYDAVDGRFDDAGIEPGWCYAAFHGGEPLVGQGGADDQERVNRR